MKKGLYICLVLGSIISNAQETETKTCHLTPLPAPIGIMGDHLHKPGEYMISYRYMFMKMDGLREGTDRLSNQEVFDQGYMVAPTDMEMHMHMLGLMFAPIDKVTLMVMTHYGEKEMGHVSRPNSMAEQRNGSSFDMNTEGWGDTTVSGLFHLWSNQVFRVHGQLGLNIPTGEITERAYPMHFSSGTWDILPALTLRWDGDSLSGGAQLKGRIHLDENDEGFTYGDEISLTPWVGMPLSSAWSVTTRLLLEWKDKVSGQDRRFQPPFMAPPMDPENTGGLWVEAGLGLSVKIAPGNRLSAEGLLPLYQDLNGPQHQRDYGFVVGWQASF